MKAVVITGTGVLEYREVPEPKAGPGDLIVEVKACGICGGDLHFYNGTFPPMGPTPYVLGHEFAGVIVEKGADVSDYWHIGDRVVSDNTAGACGRCPSCEKGNYVCCPQRTSLGCSVDGGFAKYVKIPSALLKLYPNCMYKIPERLSFEEATLMDPAGNAYNAVIQQGNFRSGETVVVFGAGPLGLLSLQQACIAGASRAVLIGMSGDKKVRFGIAERFGADLVLASDEEPDLSGSLKRYFDDLTGVSMVVDAAGAASILPLALDVVRNEGVVVRIAVGSRPASLQMDAILGKNVTIQGHGGYNQESWRNSLNLAACGKLDLKSLITQVLPLEEYKAGFEMMKKLDACKVVLIP